MGFWACNVVRRPCVSLYVVTHMSVGGAVSLRSRRDMNDAALGLGVGALPRRRAGQGLTLRPQKSALHADCASVASALLPPVPRTRPEQDGAHARHEKMPRTKMTARKTSACGRVTP